MCQTAWAQVSQSTIRGSRIPCINNVADNHACSNIDLLARVSKIDLDAGAKEGELRGPILNDIWGWTDPDTKREYALVGTSNSVAFVDVTDPINPIYQGKLLGHTSEKLIIWRDMKVYKNHMYVTADGPDNGMQVFDLRQLREFDGIPRNFQPIAHYDGISPAHNLAINEESGFAYITGYSPSTSEQGVKDVCGGRGLHIVNIQNPANPTYAGCFADLETGKFRDGYTHDAQCVIYRGPDKKYQGHEICIGSNESHISIADVTDKSNPIALSSASYPNVGYSHQGWLTPDQEYFLMNDEFDESNNSDVNNTRTIIWDLSDLDDPIFHSEFDFASTGPDHNLYVYGDYMFASNYGEGLRIVDISNINQPREIAFFDTDTSDLTSFSGAWSNYRFPNSGTTIVGSDPDGLIILDPLLVTITHNEASAKIPEIFSLSPAYPNPFNPVTSAVLTLPEQTKVRAEVIDLLGRSVDLLEDGILSAGEHILTFDAGQLPSGSYYIRVQAGQYTTGTRVMLIK